VDDPRRAGRAWGRSAFLWLQGYLPIFQVCLTKVYKFAGLYIDTGSGIINKSNVGPLVPLVKRLIR
jgi:simple sugar transport system substrate-binding protein